MSNAEKLRLPEGVRIIGDEIIVEAGKFEVLELRRPLVHNPGFSLGFGGGGDVLEYRFRKRKPVAVK